MKVTYEGHLATWTAVSSALFSNENLKTRGWLTRSWLEINMLKQQRHWNHKSTLRKVAASSLLTAIRSAWHAKAVWNTWRHACAQVCAFPLQQTCACGDVPCVILTFAQEAKELWKTRPVILSSSLASIWFRVMFLPSMGLKFFLLPLFPLYFECTQLKCIYLYWSVSTRCHTKWLDAPKWRYHFHWTNSHSDLSFVS